MASADMFYTRSGLFKATLSAFLTWLGDEFSKYGDEKLKVFLVRNLSDMRQPGRTRNTKASDSVPVYGEEDKDTVEYPLMRVAMAEVSIDTEKGGLRRQRANNGVVIGIDREQGVAYTDTMVPVKASLGCRIDSADLDQLLIIAHMLMLATPRLSFRFLSESGTVPVETTVSIEPSLTIPQADLGSPGSPYTLETTFVMSTYIGNITKQRLITSVEVHYTSPSSSFSVFSPERLSTTLDEVDTIHHYDLFDRTSAHYKYAPEEGT